MEAFERTESGAGVPAHPGTAPVQPPAQTRVRVDIGEIALNGFSLAPGDERIVRSSVETELARLLAMRPLPPRLAQSGAAPCLPGRPLDMAGSSDPGSLGRSIAAALYRGLHR